MIRSKQDLFDYLEQDKKALGIARKRPRLIGDEIWRFQILLRKCEYYKNKKSGIFQKIIFMFMFYRFYKLRVKLGFTIPLNVFGPGLSIAHYGQITVNGNAKVGKNCRIHEGVTIGATGGNDKAPILGDNIFIGTGAKIIGEIKIADNIAIGANAVVVKSILEESITVGGIPAKKISNNDSSSLLMINN